MKNTRPTVETPRHWTRRTLFYVVTPLALVGITAAVARATMDTTWIVAGQPSSAGKLKTALDDAERRLALLKTSSASLQATVTSLRWASVDAPCSCASRP